MLAYSDWRKYVKDDTSAISAITQEELTAIWKSEDCPTVDDSLWHFGNSISEKTFFPKRKAVIFNPPATIVFWADGTKTVVKCMEGEEFNPEVGLAMCLAKYVLGKSYKKWFRDGMKKGRWQNEKDTNTV